METSKLQLGVEVGGIRLTAKVLSNELAQSIKRLVQEHRIVVFRDQGKVSGEKQAEISKYFGTIDRTLFEGDPIFPHPKCHNADVYRISNDPEEGCTNVGRSGWHIDGHFIPEPFCYVIYNMFDVPKTGPTDFIGFRELIDSIPAKMRERWERLWIVSSKGNNCIHPLVYPHPVTSEPVMCFHLGFTNAFIWDKDTPNERKTDHNETKEILEEIRNEIEKDRRRLVYAHEWKDGDFVITDNLAVAHFASDDSSRPRSKVGLRVLHRTTIKGNNRPTK